MNSQSVRAEKVSQDSVDVQFVNRSEYCKLALSTRKLVRSDQGHLGLRGLLDPLIGKCYVIAENELFGPIMSRATAP